jgi:nucleotide-binding universal stress UspA family protein
MSFRRILAALDCSFYAPFVFGRALEQAKVKVSNLAIVHTIHMELTTQPSPTFDLKRQAATTDIYAVLRHQQENRIQQAMQKAQDWLGIYCQQAQAKGINAELVLRVGKADGIICEVARAWNADLIVLGQREHQGLKEATLGSISNYVLHHAPCSVLLVRSPIVDEAIVQAQPAAVLKPISP